MLPVLLAIDDEPLLLQVYRRVLQSATHEVILAGTWDEAVEAASQLGDRLELVIVDIHLGSDDGIALARKLSADRPDMGVLIATGDFEADCGGFQVVEKPFTVKALRESVQDCLEKTIEFL